ncbi:hypothetical protein EPR50_G00193560, partial [Perca flavescens]
GREHSLVFDNLPYPRLLFRLFCTFLSCFFQNCTLVMKRRETRLTRRKTTDTSGHLLMWLLSYEAGIRLQRQFSSNVSPGKDWPLAPFGLLRADAALTDRRGDDGVAGRSVSAGLQAALGLTGGLSEGTSRPGTSSEAATGRRLLSRRPPDRLRENSRTQRVDRSSGSRAELRQRRGRVGGGGRAAAGG